MKKDDPPTFICPNPCERHWCTHRKEHRWQEDCGGGCVRTDNEEHTCVEVKKE